MAAAVIALIASSAPGGTDIPSGDSGAQAVTSRVAGAERSGAEAKVTPAASLSLVAALDYIATATPWLGALRLAPLGGNPLRRRPFIRGRLAATRTLELAAESGGEANYIEGGTDDSLAREVRHRDVTRRACASGRGLALNCAGVSEREKGMREYPRAVAAQDGKVQDRSRLVPGLSDYEDSVSSRSETCRARNALAFYVRRANEWARKMGAGMLEAPAGYSAGSRLADLPCPRYLARVWRTKARAARLRFERWFERTYEKWACIHEREGAWNANTGNGYYGGLQMTRWFQRTYGPEFVRRYGTADRWPVFAQLLAAERAWQECRCFRQWGTAGLCGLT